MIASPSYAPLGVAPLGVALVGYGLAGQTFHAPLIAATPGLALRVVVSSRPEAVRGDLPEVEVLADLDAQFPGIRFRMIDEQDRLRPHVRFFVRGDAVFDLAVPLAPHDELLIVQALSGG